MTQKPLSWPYSLVGLPWNEAEGLLKARGETWQTRLTAPPGPVEPEGELRVVAERSGPDGLCLVLSARDYRRENPVPKGPLRR